MRSQTMSPSDRLGRRGGIDHTLGEVATGLEMIGDDDGLEVSLTGSHATRPVTSSNRPARNPDLVLRQFSIDGYALFILTRASAIVKRQWILTFASLRGVSQATTSLRTNSVASRRRSRHCRSKIESSVSAMFSQLPCTGVGWISTRRASRRA